MAYPDPRTPYLVNSSNMPDIDIKLEPGASIPKYSTEEAAGADLYAYANGSVLAGERSGLISTGVSVKIPPGYYAEIKPRSGLALNRGISVLAGVIDSDYRGIIQIILYNSGTNNYEYSKGDRIAQLIFKKYEKVVFKQVSDLGISIRSDGFGSSGR